ncbi:hypothetical protein MWU57_05275 [Isoptericola sp. S6320L]|uniref:hypothetical protein n=1 Tax=Isoptericola sp. S6320L TaxID=2926411 RepID=UPI001FF15A38|nr:hypothetical protein [Isoptericola sp. S6320L]MCK0116437.1 hypothetical protein [Isoptericola sp. S6320L]
MPSTGSSMTDGLRAVGLVLLMVLGLLVLLVVLAVHDVLTPDDGDRRAADVGRQTVQELAADLEPGYAEPLDAENLAQRVVDESASGVTVLGWEGSSGTDEGAVVEVAIRAQVEGSQSGWFDAGSTAGRSLTCWRFTVHAGEHDGAATYEEIGCPDDLDRAPAPDPTPLPSLGPDAEATVLAALDELPPDATPADAESSLRSAFPEFVDVRAEREDDELVAAVGVMRSRDCVVGVRPDGEPAWRYSAFDRIQLEPGELGCAPGLYLRPITTH